MGSPVSRTGAQRGGRYVDELRTPLPEATSIVRSPAWGKRGNHFFLLDCVIALDPRFFSSLRICTCCAPGFGGLGRCHRDDRDLQLEKKLEIKTGNGDVLAEKDGRPNTNKLQIQYHPTRSTHHKVALVEKKINAAAGMAVLEHLEAFQNKFIAQDRIMQKPRVRVGFTDLLLPG